MERPFTDAARVERSARHPALDTTRAGWHDYLRDVTRLDHQMLDVITGLVAPVEAGIRTAADWEFAILTGFAAWHHLRTSNGGMVVLNAEEQTLTVEEASS